jgi:hypothetical protein
MLARESLPRGATRQARSESRALIVRLAGADWIDDGSETRIRIG